MVGEAVMHSETVVGKLFLRVRKLVAAGSRRRAATAALLGCLMGSLVQFCCGCCGAFWRGRSKACVGLDVLD